MMSRSPSGKLNKNQNNSVGFQSEDISPAGTYAGASSYANNTYARFENNAISAEQIGNLIDFLSEAGGCLNEQSRSKFIDLIKSTLLFLEGKSMLSVIVRKHGWNGTTFKREVDCYQFYNDLSHAYLICNYSGPSRARTDDSSYYSGNLGMESQTADNIAIQSFCPDLVFNMTMVPDMLSSAVSAKFWGCCLLVDISGFT